MPTRPTFALCGTFSGTTDVTAERWLSKFDFEMEDYQDAEGRYPPTKYLGYLNMLLIEDAAKWSEKDPDARRLLAEAKSNPTPTTVDNFRTLFCESFPSKEIEVSPIPFEVELAELHQRPEEPLSAYYKRVCGLMKGVGAKDRPASTPASPGLNPMESAFLDTVLRAFIRGLNDQEIRKEATRGMAQADRSLLGIYSLAEEARRTSLEVQKLLDEEAKTDELKFYKSLVEKNLPQQQVASLLASYHAAKEARGQPQQSQHRWTYHTDPPQPVPEQTHDLPKPSEGSRYYSPHQQDRPPSYQSEPPAPASIPTLAQNPSRIGTGRGGSSNSRFRNNQPTPKDMPDRAASKNPWINGTLNWSFSKDGLLCVKCGTKGHSTKTCDALPLPAWEQSYLRMIVFGDNPQANFASVGFGEFDGAVRAYGTSAQPTTDSQASSATGPPTPTSSIDSYISPRSNSVQFGVAGLLSRSHSADVKVSQAHSDAFLGEGSAPNKRAHVEEEVPESSQQASRRRQEKQPERPQSTPTEPQQFVPQQQQYQPPMMQSHTGMNQGPSFQQQVPPTQAIPQPQQQPAAQAAQEEERPKRKGRKRTGKKVDPQPLVGMFNGTQYENPVSVRQILQNNRLDLSWMDFVAWSPAACKELKRLCTRVPKKRIPKLTEETSQAPGTHAQNQTNQAPLFQPIPVQQVPQIPVTPLQSVPFQPMMSGTMQDPQTGMTHGPAVQFQPMPAQASRPASQFSTQQTLGNPDQALALASSSVSTASTVEAEKHTRFLSSLVGVDKAFRVPSMIKKPNGAEVKLEKSQTQADQGSDMNVLSTGLVRMLGLPKYLLSDIGFKGLSMRTADHRDTVLQHWVWLHIGVEGIWRNIRCFVAPEVVAVTESGRAEYLSLILGIPWLYSVDASISIRQSTIFIGDRTIGEEVRGVVGPEMVFCKDHNLLMYPKAAMATPKGLPESLPKATVIELDSSDSSSSDSEDDLSDIEEIETKQDF